MLIASHDLDLVRSLADTVAVLREGRIVPTGPPLEVLVGLHSTEDLADAFPGTAEPDVVGAPSVGTTTRAARSPSPAPLGRAPVTAAGFVLLIVVVMALLLMIVR